MTHRLLTGSPVHLLVVPSNDEHPDSVPALLRDTADALEQLGDITIVSMTLASQGFYDGVDWEVFNMRVVYVINEE